MPVTPGGGAFLAELGYAYVPRNVTSGDLDGDGVLEIDIASGTEGAVLVLDDGLVLQGIRVVDSGDVTGTAPAYYGELSVLVRVAPGNTATLVHLALAPAAVHRLRVAGYAANVVVDQHTLVRVQYDVGSQQWVGYAEQVVSVNGKRGAVVLDAIDVGADEDGAAITAVSDHVAAADPHTQYTRSLRYSSTTSGSGTYSATFSSAFANTPNVQAQIVGGTANQFALVTSRSTTGFTVTAYTRDVVSVLGVDVLAGSPTATNGLTVDVLVTSND